MGNSKWGGPEERIKFSLWPTVENPMVYVPGARRGVHFTRVAGFTGIGE